MAPRWTAFERDPGYESRNGRSSHTPGQELPRVSTPRMANKTWSEPELQTEQVTQAVFDPHLDEPQQPAGANPTVAFG